MNGTEHIAPRRHHRGLVVSDLYDDIRSADRRRLDTYLDVAAGAPGAACVMWMPSVGAPRAPDPWQLACVAHNGRYELLFGRGALLGRSALESFGELADACHAGLARACSGAGAQTDPVAVTVRDGASCRTEYHAVSWVPALDAAGVARGVLALFHDATPWVQSLGSAFGSIAHDARDPLLAIRLLAERLVRGPGDSPAAQEATSTHGAREAGRIGELTNGLSRLIDDLAHLAWLTAGSAARLERRPCDLGAAVRSICDGLRAKDDAPLVVTTECVYGQWDTHAIGRVVTNLVNNARRHGPALGRITVSLERRVGAVDLAVRDEGAGIPEEDRAIAFHPWQRSERSRGTPGMGLGLFIVREIVAAHGGHVTGVRLRPRGFVMRVRLPMA